MELSNTAWKIVQLLSKGDKTPSEIAKVLRISHPSVHAHLKNLESQKMIVKKEAVKGKTRPFLVYSLGDGFVYFVKALSGSSEKRMLVVDDNLLLHLNIWSIPQQEYHEVIEAYWWAKLKPVIGRVEAVAIFGSVARGDAKVDSDIDVLVLSKGKLSLSTSMVGKRIFVPQIFVFDDFKNSVEKKSKFASEVKKSMRIIYDPRGVLSGIKG